MTLEEILRQVFFYWTPSAIMVPLIDGVIFGLLMRRLRPSVTPYAMAFTTTTLFFFWIVPFVVFRLMTPGLFYAGLHTIGSYLQSFLFTATMVGAMTVHRALRHE